MELTPHIHLVASGGMGFDLTDSHDCHVYLVDGGSEAALVDAGAGYSADAILDHARAAGVEADRIRWLLLTHGHADHAGGANALCERLPQLRVVASPEVAGWLRTGDERGISLDMGKKAGFYPGSYRFEACPVAKEVREGGVLTVGDIRLEVIETPGHSRGHLCFKGTIDRRVVLFAGDLVFFGGQVSLQNIWDCDIPAYARSMKRLEGAGIDALLPGHLSVTLCGGQRHIDAANNLFERIYVPRAIF
jgi:glyoxylase-like metal-dependent hydrolase (beta-lactamase superfamily II)